jgi:NADH-quinone oxidoreductase subunit L
VFLTFFGEARWAGSEHIQHAVHHPHEHDHPEDEHAGHEPHPGDPGPNEVPHGTAGYHPHESPWTMLVPLALLSLGAIFAGFLFHGAYLDAEQGAEFWQGSVAFNAHLMHAMHEVPTWVKLSATVVMLVGLLIAWWAYIKDTSIPGRFVGTFRGLYAFLLNKWYFDELYDLIFVRPAFVIGRFFWKKGDQGTIDRFGPNGISALVSGSGVLARRLQSGYVYTYALVMLLGLAGAATWAMTR